MDKPPFNTRTLTIRGRQIFIQEKSPDRPITILFIHGRCLSIQSWQQQFSSELLNPFRLVALDLLGHGSSERTADLYEYSLAGLVQLVLDLVEKLQLTNFILAGHSLGGHIAIQALPKLPDCQGVFCMTMPLTKPIDFGRMYLNGALLMRAYQANPKQADLSTYVDSLFRPNAPEPPSFITDDFLRADPAIHTGLVQGLLAGDYQDEMAIIRTSKVPVAIVQGALEQVHKLDYMIGADLPLWHNQLLLIPEAGHLVQWENSEAVNQLLGSFLADIQQNQWLSDAVN